MPCNFYTMYFKIDMNIIYYYAYSIYLFDIITLLPRFLPLNAKSNNQCTGPIATYCNS